MQKRVLLFGFVLSLLIVQIASASVSFSDPNAVYNLGDTLNMSIVLVSNSNLNGFFIASLKCDEGEVEILKMPYSSVAGQSETFNVKARLDQNLIESLEGNCFVEARYEGEQGTSKTFEISSIILVNFDIQGNLFEPKDTIAFSGTAMLKNGKPINGTARISIVGNSTIKEVEVKSGLFSGEFVLLENTASGSYSMQAIILEQENGQTLNSGKSSENFRVKQVVKAVEIALSEVSLMPGKPMTYQVILYDQVFGKAENEVYVKLIGPLGRVAQQKTVISSVNNEFNLENSYEPGEWTIEAETNGIKSTANFEVQTLKNVSVVIENSTIFVSNVGNVVYDLPLEIQVGDVPEIIELNLKVGESKTYKVFAPDGNYDLYAKTNDYGLSLGQAWLTGRAIEIKGLSEGKNNILKILSWIIIALALAFAVVWYHRKYSMNRTYSTPNSSLSGPIKMKETPLMGSLMWKSSKKPDVKEVRKLSDIMMANKMQASDSGRKEEVTVIAMKVKNYDELYKYKGTEAAMNVLVQAAGLAKNAKAQVTREGNFTIMTFSQTATGSANASLIAVRTAKEIESLLKSHNRKYSRKVSFGLGAVTGEMIVERKQGAIAHTSIGTIIPSAKKIAEHAHDQLLISDSTRSKLRGQIKVDKGIGGMYWNVQSFVDRSNHNEFINRFMERRADESKSF